MTNILNSACTLLIFDSKFPQMQLKGFRGTEFEGYFAAIEHSCIVNIPTGQKNDDYYIGRSKEQYEKEIREYLKQHFGYEKRFIEYDPSKPLVADLAYILFLNDTFTVLDIIEKNKIPFVFCLYPGGGFFINNSYSDEKLKRIFKSPYFKKVLVTQEYTKEYLLQKKLCEESDIYLKYGGFVQFEKEKILSRKYYPNDKQTFDICFVAFRYMELGLNKGYDIFIEVAKILHSKYLNIRFHVVGNWDQNEINISDLGDNIIFYGAKNEDFSPKFYSEIDLILTPNRPLVLGSQIDGFPLGGDAGYCGVPIFTSDELSMNHNFIPNKEIVIISLNAFEIANTIEKYYKNPNELIPIGIAGQKKMYDLFDTKNQLEARISLLNSTIIASKQPKKLTNSDKLFIFKFNLKRNLIFIIKKIYRIVKIIKLKFLTQI